MWITTNCGKFFKRWEPDHLTCLMRNLYAGQEATVRTKHGTMDWFKIGEGVYQGYISSPCLFNLYAEYIMWNWAGWSTAGIKIAGRNINNLRYRDDFIDISPGNLKEDWAPKNWCFQNVVLEKTLESPLAYKEIIPVINEINPEYSLEGMMLKL